LHCNNIIDDPSPSYSYYPSSYYSPGYYSRPYYSNYAVSGSVYPSHPVPYGSGYYYSANAPSYSIGFRKDQNLAKGTLLGNNSNLKTPIINTPKNERINNPIVLPKNQDFSDISRDIKNMKLELFGNAEADMSFYKKNRNAYFDKAWLEKAHKIAKILELEELVEFYQKKPQNSSK